MSIFLESVIKRLTFYKELGDNTFSQLEEKDFYFQPDDRSNSLEVIIQHMSGNMLSRWTDFLTEDGEKPWRKRDDEFEIHASPKEKLLEDWEKGWACVLNSLKQLTEADLGKTIYIRSEPLIVIDAINRQLAHYPYHVGQIIYIAKMIKGKNWKSLSIEKGGSEQFHDEMKAAARHAPVSNRKMPEEGDQNSANA